MNPTQQENPTNKAKPDFYSKPSSRPAQGRFKRFLVLILSFVLLGTAVVLSLWAWNFIELHPRSDDGVARANIIGMAPRVSGPIIKVNVRDNQWVRGGDLLFEIDPADYQLSVDRAQAALDALDQQIVTAKSQDAQLKFQVKAEEAGVQLIPRLSKVVCLGELSRTGIKEHTSWDEGRDLSLVESRSAFSGSGRGDLARGTVPGR